MSEEKCRNCIYFNGGNCQKLKDDLNLKSNLDQLFEGYTSEFLKETILDFIIEKLKSIKKRTIKDDAIEEISNEILFDVETELYWYLGNHLELWCKIDPLSDLKCNYYL